MDEITKLKEENEKLKKLNDYKSNVITISAHELRTSLSAFKWMLKMFLDGDLGELSNEQKTLVQKSYESNERTLSLVNEMLSINHKDEIDLTYTYEKVDMNEILDGVLFDFIGESYKRGVEILFLKEKIELPKINIDKNKIRIVIQGLIENALKYSRSGDRVFVSLAQKNNMIDLTVKDTGIGIPEKDKDKIFTKYFRTDISKEKEKDGSGLGLNIIKDIVENHKGKISFEGEEGKGTTFIVSLPIS